MYDFNTVIRDFKQTTTATARERGKTKGLMSRTMALHVYYKTLYISQSFSAKQQREITTFCVKDNCRRQILHVSIGK